ncbi:hypothetical protein [Moraxella catarrhalis]|uniref:hypothetical protein n=1 Tax=Moraxella catarrhalis TaxID=480 RepID=UPI0002D8205F|nr:hypothetical protein [Moraxella catarrhalis]
MIKKAQNAQIGLSASDMSIGVTSGRHGIYPKIGWKIDANSRAYIAKKRMLSYLYGEHARHCIFIQGIKIYGE